jgi:glycosyltransferase involved in cell wall biosynthesis
MIVTFVIPTLNEAKHLERCVQSIRQLTRPAEVDEVEIVVVDTGSTDQTLAIARAIVTRVLEARGGTVASARNIGAHGARGDILAFVDADCELPAEWLLYGIEHLKRPDVAAMGTSLAAPRAHATWVERHSYGVTYATRRETYGFVRWLPTSNLLVWRHAFDAVHGFTETLVTCEDSDFGYRLARAHTLVEESRVKTRHLRESRTVRELFRRERWRGLGNFQSWRLHGWDRHECLSVVAPLAFVALMVAIVLTAIVAPGPQKALFLTIETFAISVVPFLMLLKRGVHPHAGISSFLCSYALAWVYLSARGIALIDHRRAVEPVGATKVECQSRI